MKKKVKKKSRGKHNKKSQKKKISKYFIYAIVLIAIIIIALVLIDSGHLSSYNGDYVVELEDRCGILFNQIIHHIKDENNCQSLCKIECQSQELSYKKVEFSLNDSACNSCTCYCR